ncbi:MAG: PEP-CTERM system histidine kinase PrsK [Opitutae bacterium]|nr:PEP-CTERM system histidine kinase PrsK [Opitutae bacterium]
MDGRLAAYLVTTGAVILALGLGARLGLGVFRGQRSMASAAQILALTLQSVLAVSDMLILAVPERMPVWRAVGVLCEGALAPAWIWFTALFAREYEDARLPKSQLALIVVACLMPFWAAYLAWAGVQSPSDFAASRIVYLRAGGFYFYIGFALCAVAGLGNIETTLANAVHFRRWQIKFVLLGAVSILAAQLLHSSQALLYRSLDMEFAGLRALALLLGAGLMWYSDLRRGPEIRVLVSKRLAIKSVVLVTAGLYLLVLGIMGEGVRLFGDALARVVLVALSFVTGLGLLVLFLSDKVRRKVRLFLQMNFYGEKYDYRIQWTRFTERMTSARSQSDLYQAALSACCETFGTIGAALFLYDHDRRVHALASVLEMDRLEDGFEADSPIVARLRAGRAVLALDDVPPEERAASPWLKDARCLIPIYREDALDGFVLLGPALNRAEEYDEEDFELMETMARHISAALLNMRLLEQLARSRDMEIMGKVSAFVLHDLKNHVYTLSLMTDNARKYISNPEFQRDMVESLGSTVGKMKILIAQLKGLPDRQTLKRESVRLLTLAREATRLLGPERFSYEGEDVEALVDGDEMGKVVLNIGLNALEASKPGQRVVIETGLDHGPFIRVVDQGVGIAESFIKDGLFEPFKSTKAKGMGIGLYQCQQIVAAHGGRIEVRSSPGAGSEFVVRLPGDDGVLGEQTPGGRP